MNLWVGIFFLFSAILISPQVIANHSLPDSDIRPPDKITDVGKYGGLQYLQYDGLFCMKPDQSGACESLVPYRITAPEKTRQGNGILVMQPPHFAVGVDHWGLARSFLLGRRFSHVSVGFSTFLRNILDPTVPGIHIRGQGPCNGAPTCVVEDLDIITTFVEALESDPDGVAMLGPNSRFRYITGFSNSSAPLLKLVNDGRAEGHFDFVLPFTTGPTASPDGCFRSPQCSIAAGKYSGLVIVQNSEFDDRGITANHLWHDNGTARDHYRYYTEPGTPHIPDFPETTEPADKTTPATWRPALHARFLQGHRWLHLGIPPASSNQLVRDDAGVVVLDESGNTLAEDTQGRMVPRLPFVELGEAHFKMGNTNIPPGPLPPFLLGSYDEVRSAEELFGSYKGYLFAYLKASLAYAFAVRLDIEDSLDLMERATLCPPLTYTETYLAEYEAHATLEECE